MSPSVSGPESAGGTGATAPAAGELAEAATVGEGVGVVLLVFVEVPDVAADALRLKDKGQGL
ncbi:MAG TPA: hypothetical protein VEI26_01785 [Terriglobales bacterium]|nr:hypothetical protein [Terriglobales bacterium]